MKQITITTLLTISFLFSIPAYAQEVAVENEVTHLIFAGKKIPVPKNGSAYSGTEIVNCEGISIRWHEFPDSTMAASSFQQNRVHLEKGRESSPVSFVSFGSELAGYRMYWPIGKEYLFYLFGVINNTPVIVTINTRSSLGSSRPEVHSSANHAGSEIGRQR